MVQSLIIGAMQPFRELGCVLGRDGLMALALAVVGGAFQAEGWWLGLTKLKGDRRHGYRAGLGLWLVGVGLLLAGLWPLLSYAGEDARPSDPVPVFVQLLSDFTLIGASFFGILWGGAIFHEERRAWGAVLIGLSGLVGALAFWLALFG